MPIKIMNFQSPMSPKLMRVLERTFAMVNLPVKSIGTKNDVLGHSLSELNFFLCQLPCEISADWMTETDSTNEIPY